MIKEALTEEFKKQIQKNSNGKLISLRKKLIFQESRFVDAEY